MGEKIVISKIEVNRGETSISYEFPDRGDKQGYIVILPTDQLVKGLAKELVDKL